MFLRKTLPMMLCFCFGVFAMFGFFAAEGTKLNIYYESFAKWLMIIATFAMLLGIGNLLRVNTMKVMKNHPDKIYCTILLIGAITTAGFGIFQGIDKGVCMYIFNYMIKPLQSTMFSLLAFFVASAAFRAFRAKSFESTILLITAFIVMLSRVPIGTSIWPGFASMSEWILSTVNMAGSRAITLGAAVGATAAALKIILGIETKYLGGE